MEYYSDHLPNESMISVPIENIIVGTIYIGVPLFCLVPYLACLWAIFSDPNLRRQSTYIIIYHIGIADILQLVTDGIISGLFTVYGSTGDYTINKYTGAFLNLGWIVYCTLAHALAFNRYVWLCRPQWREKIFSRRKTQFLMYASWCYGLVWFVAYFTPNIDVVFNVYRRSWNYYTPKYQSYVCWLLELIQDTFHCIASVVWYALAFWKIRTQVALISAEEIREHRNEVRLLIQAFLICVMIALTLIGFFAIPLLPQTWSWTGFTANFLWLSCCANNCFVYLYFNKLLRDRVFNMFRYMRTNLMGRLLCQKRQPSTRRFSSRDMMELNTLAVSQATSLLTAIGGPKRKRLSKVDIITANSSDQLL